MLGFYLIRVYSSERLFLSNRLCFLVFFKVLVRFGNPLVAVMVQVLFGAFGVS
jgi:hypothetical protein